MSVSTFGHPNRVEFGQGVAASIGECLANSKVTKVFLVTHPILTDLDSFKSVERSLEAVRIDYFVFSDFGENPTDRSVDDGVARYNEHRCDAIVVVGGGSAVDCAKAVGIVVSNGGSILDYVGMDQFDEPLPPLFAIPTTSGTGSEVSPYAVITDTERNIKVSCSGWSALPKITFVDPLMTASMPPMLTAATGMDALSHAVEALYSKGAMPQTDALALGAIKLILENLPRAVADGSDVAAREGMAMAAMMAGSAMCAGCGAVHALGHQLSTEYGISHGMAMSLMMPSVVNYNLHGDRARAMKIAAALGITTDGVDNADVANTVSLTLLNLAKSIGLPASLKEAGADPARISDCAVKALDDGNMPDNPITPSLSEVERLYENAFAGTVEWNPSSGGFR